MAKKLEKKVRGWLAGALVLFVMFSMATLTEAKSLTSVSPEQEQIKVTNNDSDSKKKEGEKDKDKDKDSGKKGFGGRSRRKS